MLKTKKYRVLLVAVVIFSMLAVYGSIPVATASIIDAKDTISDSDVSANDVIHAFTFTTETALVNTDKIVITFPTGFTNILEANIVCPASSTAEAVGGGGLIVTCTVNDNKPAGAQTLNIASTSNPTAGGYTINIATRDTGDVLIEEVDVMVYIIDDITMDANVPATLTFGITGLNVGDEINGIITTSTSTATTTPFGTLSLTASSTVGQQLAVSTNADDGYTVTVQQTANLSTAGGADIDSFKNGTPPGPYEVWSAPSALVDTENTFGHMGVTSDDDEFAGAADPFGNQKFAGLNGTAPLAVMYHDGPVNGTGAGTGLTKVAYSVEISAMQEAGDYSTSLTYICTPQF